MTMTLTFDAVSEQAPGAKWHKRWLRSWPAYEAWFVARGGDAGPERSACRAALDRHMPELLPIYDQLVAIAGGGDRAARFLSTWCPPRYLGGCSLAAMSDGTDVRLLRNYDLAPDLNEGLLLRSEWSGRPVMGMVEFLWGLSDGINDAGLSVALAYGGRSETGEGFGVTTILRYVLEVCDTVEEALIVLDRVPSHMAYNLVLADASGATASVELAPGGGAKRSGLNFQNAVARLRCTISSSCAGGCSGAIIRGRMVAEGAPLSGRRLSLSSGDSGWVVSTRPAAASATLFSAAATTSMRISG